MKGEYCRLMIISVHHRPNVSGDFKLKQPSDLQTGSQTHIHIHVLDVCGQQLLDMKVNVDEKP
jgi:hypothetical protein